MRCQADVAEWQSHQRPRRQPSLRDEDRHPTGRQSRAAVVCTPFVCYSAAPRYCAPASVPVRYVVKMSSSCSVHNVRVYSQFEFHRACHRHSCCMRAVQKREKCAFDRYHGTRILYLHRFEIPASGHLHLVCTDGCGRSAPSVSCSRRRLAPHRGGGGTPCRKRLRKPAVVDGTCETRSRKPLLVFRAEVAEQSPTACADPPAPPLRA